MKPQAQGALIGVGTGLAVVAIGAVSIYAYQKWYLKQSDANDVSSIRKPVVVDRADSQQAKANEAELLIKVGSIGDNEGEDFDVNSKKFLDLPAKFLTSGINSKYSPLELQMTSAIRKRYKARQAAPERYKATKIKSINTLLMKLPQIRQGFEVCRATFDKFATNGTVFFGQFEKGCKELGFTNVSTSRLKGIYAAADVSPQPGIQFKEFILSLALFYLFEENEKVLDASIPKDVKMVFDIMEDAFFFFDDNGSGCLDKEEVLKGFVDSEVKMLSDNMEKHGEDGLLSGFYGLFKKMDVSGDGLVLYNEFFYVVSTWASWEGDDDDDEVAEREGQLSESGTVA